jgi:hypothetical protein
MSRLRGAARLGTALLAPRWPRSRASAPSEASSHVARRPRASSSAAAASAALASHASRRAPAASSDPDPSLADALEDAARRDALRPNELAVALGAIARSPRVARAVWGAPPRAGGDANATAAGHGASASSSSSSSPPPPTAPTPRAFAFARAVERAAPASLGVLRLVLGPPGDANLRRLDPARDALRPAAWAVLARAALNVLEPPRERDDAVKARRSSPGSKTKTTSPPSKKPLSAVALAARFAADERAALAAAAVAPFWPAVARATRSELALALADAKTRRRLRHGECANEEAFGEGKGGVFLLKRRRLSKKTAPTSLDALASAALDALGRDANLRRAMDGVAGGWRAVARALEAAAREARATRGERGSDAALLDGRHRNVATTAATALGWRWDDPSRRTGDDPSSGETDPREQNAALVAQFDHGYVDVAHALAAFARLGVGDEALSGSGWAARLARAHFATLERRTKAAAAGAEKTSPPGDEGGGGGGGGTDDDDARLERSRPGGERGDRRVAPPLDAFARALRAFAKSRAFRSALGEADWAALAEAFEDVVVARRRRRAKAREGGGRAVVDEPGSGREAGGDDDIDAARLRVRREEAAFARAVAAMRAPGMEEAARRVAPEAWIGIEGGSGGGGGGG